MLINGEHLGIKLYTDSFVKNLNPVAGWTNISKHSSNQLLKNNVLQLSIDEWLQILPKLKTTHLEGLLKAIQQ